MKGLYRRNGNGWFLSSAQLLFPVPAAIIEIAMPDRVSAQGTGKYREEREHEPETDRTNSK